MATIVNSYADEKQKALEAARKIHAICYQCHDAGNSDCSMVAETARIILLAKAEEAERCAEVINHQIKATRTEPHVSTGELEILRNGFIRRGEGLRSSTTP